MLNEEYIIHKLPNIELSYEKKIHNKVPHGDIFLIIPKGPKFLVWFHRYYQQYVCFSLELQGKKEIKEIKIVPCSFNKELCAGNGTLLYGTVFENNKKKCFSIEDIFYYKDKKTGNLSQKDKFDFIQNLLSYDIKKTFLTNESFLFGLPVMSNKYNTVVKELPHIAYTPIYIQSRLLNRRNITYYNQTTQGSNYAVFSVRATKDPDIYTHWCFNEKNILVKIGILHIASFKMSVFMNNIFREIKENKNLDALEESDDEEEFQNISPTKYVYLNKTENILCVYNYKFRRWTPIDISKSAKITNINMIEKNN